MIKKTGINAALQLWRSHPECGIRGLVSDGELRIARARAAAPVDLDDGRAA